MQTVSSANPIGDYIHEWLRTFADPYYLIMFSICIIGGYLIGRKLGTEKFFFVITFLGFYGLAIHHNIHRHYVNSCFLFMVPIIIYLISVNKNKILMYYKRIVKISFVSVVFYTTLVNWTYTEGYIVPNLFFVNQQDRTDYYTVAYYLSRIEKPKLLYYRFAERGYGTIAGALPASKYWSTQTGPTQEMLNIQHKDAVSGKADFIITYLTSDNDKLFSEIGYEKLYEFSGLALYSKYKIDAPTSTINVSNWDVLLKRKVFE